MLWGYLGKHCTISSSIFDHSFLQEKTTTRLKFPSNILWRNFFSLWFSLEMQKRTNFSDFWKALWKAIYSKVNYVWKTYSLWSNLLPHFKLVTRSHASIKINCQTIWIRTSSDSSIYFSSRKSACSWSVLTISISNMTSHHGSLWEL